MKHVRLIARYCLHAGYALTWGGGLAAGLMAAMFVYAGFAIPFEAWDLHEVLVGIFIVLPATIILALMATGRAMRMAGRARPRPPAGKADLFASLDNMGGIYAPMTFVWFVNLIAWLIVPVAIIVLLGLLF